MFTAPSNSQNVAFGSPDSGSNNNNSSLIIDNENNQLLSSQNTDNSEISNTLMSDDLNLPCNLATFLIQRACKNLTLANYLYWYLSIECEDQESIRKQDERVKEMYVTVLKTFLRKLSNGNNDLKLIHANLKKQQCFVESLVKLVKTVAKDSGNRKKKTEKFIQLLADSDAFKINFVNFEPRPLPLDPEIFIKGIVPHKVTLFNSALMPAK